MKIPGFKIQRLIGKGGMSSVYLAVQESLDRQVALKVLKKFDDPKQAARFLHEGRIIASLNHRNIITIHDVGTIGDRHFISMEYLQGRSLTDRIEEGMPLPKVLSLMEQLAACLHFVHRKGIIHRDIKPSNILFHADGTPKLTDFGIAKLLEGDQELTMEGNALGSPYYLSPEQAEGLPLDGRSDIYALGIVFYQMLTGQRPYAKNSPVETIVAHLTQPLPVLPEQYQAYQGLLEQMIAKQPEDRIGSGKELVYLIRETKKRFPAGDAGVDGHGASTHVPDDPVPQEPVGSAHRPSGRRVAWGLAAVAATALVSVSVLRTPGSGPSAPTPGPVVGSTDFQAPAPQGPVRPPDRTPVIASPAIVEGGAAEPRPSEPPPLQLPPAEPAGETAALAASTVPLEWEADERQPSVVLDATAAGNPGETTADTGNPDAQRIEDWMQAADIALQKLRLTRPEGDNAHAYYRNVLAVDADHEGALAGIRTIVDRYADMAHQALGNDNIGRARRYLHRGLDVQPDAPGLSALQVEIDERERTLTSIKSEPVHETTAGPVVESADRDGGPRREGTGNIVKDFKSAWRSIFK